MGTVLTTTLAAAFAHNLPPLTGSSIRPGGFTPSNLTAQGGMDLSREVQAAFDRQYARIARALRGGDARELRALLDDPLLPAPVRTRLADAESRAARGEEPPADTEETLAAVRRRLQARLERGVRVSFAQSITRIYL
jgi:hypothetical protein